MRLGIMQPYFFPYLGYISLIKHTDEFILFDTPQFIRHGWIERNRILKPGGGWQYIAVPLVKHGQKTPYYSQVIALLQEVLEPEYTDIVSLNKAALEKVCSYLGIDTPITVFSKMDLQIDEVNAPDEWALNICKAIDGADEYWNPPGGKVFFDVSKYEREGITIRFQKMNLREYRQGKNTFEEGLSIIDVMMYNSVQKINEMLDDFELME